MSWLDRAIVRQAPLPQARRCGPPRSLGNTHKEQTMFALHLVHHQLVEFRVLVGMLGIAGLIFWRTALKVIIAAAVLLLGFIISPFPFGCFRGGSPRFAWRRPAGRLLHPPAGGADQAVARNRPSAVGDHDHPAALGGEAYRASR